MGLDFAFLSSAQIPTRMRAALAAGRRPTLVLRCLVACILMAVKQIGIPWLFLEGLPIKRKSTQGWSSSTAKCRIDEF